LDCVAADSELVSRTDRDAVSSIEGDCVPCSSGCPSDRVVAGGCVHRPFMDDHALQSISKRRCAVPLSTDQVSLDSVSLGILLQRDAYSICGDDVALACASAANEVVAVVSDEYTEYLIPQRGGASCSGSDVVALHDVSRRDRVKDRDAVIRIPRN